MRVLQLRTKSLGGQFKKYVTRLGGGRMAKMMKKCDIGGKGSETKKIFSRQSYSNKIHRW